MVSRQFSKMKIFMVLCNYMGFYGYIFPKYINKMPYNYITASIVGKFPILLIADLLQFRIYANSDFIRPEFWICGRLGGQPVKCLYRHQFCT